MQNVPMTKRTAAEISGNSEADAGGGKSLENDAMVRKLLVRGSAAKLFWSKRPRASQLCASSHLTGH
jgi:hypothetical protein